MRFLASTFAAAICFSLPAFAVDQEIAPTTDPTTIDLTPGKPAATVVPDAGPTVREGTRYVARTGRLSHMSNGQAILTFDDGAATKTPSMMVLSNLNLFAMESVLSIKGSAVQFRVWGTVAEYKGHNYILLDKAQTTLATPAPLPRAAVPTQPQAVTKPVETTQLTESKPTTAALPAVSSQEQMMTHLLAPAPAAGQPLPPPSSNDFPTTDRSTGAAAVAPAAPALPVVREGTHLINRLARLSHTPDGHQAILTFDADGSTMKDPPMVILPNLKLEGMEAAVLGRASDIHFRVSGTVTEYKGRNFIQLDKAVAMADIETQF